MNAKNKYDSECRNKERDRRHIESESEEENYLQELAKGRSERGR